MKDISGRLRCVIDGIGSSLRTVSINILVEKTVLLDIGGVSDYFCSFF